MKSINAFGIGTVIIAIVALTIFFGSWYTIDQTEVGVILRNGAVSGTANAGLNFKLPILDSVVKLETTQQVSYWTCAPRSTACADNQRTEMQAYSSDQQPADMRVTISWHIVSTEAKAIYSEYGGLAGIENKLIARRAPQLVKTVFGQYTAQSVIQDRAKFNADVQNAIEKDLSSSVAVIDSVQVENIDFSEAYVKSIETAMQARVKIQQTESNRQEQEVAAKITVIKAQADADSQLATATAAAKATAIQGQAIADAALAKATADAKGIALVGQATADAIKEKGAALKDNPLALELARAEKWNGTLPTTMVPGSTVPFINMDTGK